MNVSERMRGENRKAGEEVMDKDKIREGLRKLYKPVQVGTVTGSGRQDEAIEESITALLKYLKENNVALKVEGGAPCFWDLPIETCDNCGMEGQIPCPILAKYTLTEDLI